MLSVRFYRLGWLVFLPTLGDRSPLDFHGITTINSGDPFSYTLSHLWLVTICIAATNGPTTELRGSEATIFKLTGD